MEGENVHFFGMKNSSVVRVGVLKGFSRDVGIVTFCLAFPLNNDCNE